MSSSKDLYKKALKELEKGLSPDQRTLLNAITRYTGELRRIKTESAAKIEELQGLLCKAEERKQDANRLTELREQLDAATKERDIAAKKHEQMERIMGDWERIKSQFTSFTEVKAKCLTCSLHFIVCTEHPERHSGETLFCPECGAHEGKFTVWKKPSVSPFIFDAVPGGEYLQAALNEIWG